MLFYKATALITDEEWIKASKDRNIREEFADRIKEKTEEFNERTGDGVYCFISEISGKKLICGIISSETFDVDETVLSFIENVSAEVKNVKTAEITLLSANNLMDYAIRSHYIEDKEGILERYGLEKINRKYYCSLEYDEKLINGHKEKEAVYDAAERMLAIDSLFPELERIYSGKTKTKAYGHPVHYLVETDNNDARVKFTNTLVQALYDNGRLRSKRYCCIDIKPTQDISRFLFDELYKSCAGGTMVVKYAANDDSEDDEFANSELEVISLICETAKKYRNQTLTVLCFPRNCGKIKSTFFEYLGAVSVVEIKEDLANAERSRRYLKMLCKDQCVRADKALLNKIEDDKKYLPEELRRIFDVWYDKKMKTSVFPQYKSVETCRKAASKKPGCGSAFEELNGMVGLQEAKSVIGKALNYYKIQKIYKDKGIKQDKPAMHMVFTGNPGTAKTTVARLFARIMKENGLLSKGHLVEVGRGDLVGKYVGWTAQIVMNKFKAAMGGVLFIDEAYSLAEEKGGSYGDEAINTIVQEMENRREDLVVIFAGYPNEMETFLNKNPGLRSRIAFHVQFADYDSQQLCDIARMIGKSKGVTLSEAAIAKLSTVFDSARLQPDFGNGRYVRNVIELSKMNQAARILSMDPDDVTENVLTSIEDVDIELPAVSDGFVNRRIGFAS